MIAGKLMRTPMYASPLNSKLFTLLLASLVTIGTLAKKEKDLHPKRQIALPLASGLLLFFGSLWLYGLPGGPAMGLLTASGAAYATSSLLGTLLLHIALDNVSKLISSRLGKDRWNVEEESFLQATQPVRSPLAVNIPMQFYYRKRVRRGYIPIANVTRGTLLLGTPGAGKSYGVVSPYIRQLVAAGWCLCIFDFKFPDLGKIAYYHYLLGKQRGQLPGYRFHVINLNDVARSRRINPLKREYIRTLADATETAEALVEALKKGDKSSGSDQFFTQSAVNFLAATIFFLSRYQQGRYSSLPHVLAFLNHGYEEVFRALFSEPELVSLMSPFATAFRNRAFEQLEGQVGTLKVFVSRLATKETYWVFSGEDFDLKISSLESPSMLMLAGDPQTMNINSACYSVVLNRLTRLLNSKGNRPSGIVVDECPVLYCHRIDTVLSTARGNRVSVLLGLQELPMLRAQYGKETADTIVSVVGNVLSGSVRDKETLDWLERIFGKVKQQSESLSIDRAKTSLSLSERLEPLIPAGKIAALRTGEMVGLLAPDAEPEFTGKYEPAAVNCRIALDQEAIRREEANYRELPVYYDFGDHKDALLTRNFQRINREVADIIRSFGSPAPQKKTIKPSEVLAPPQPKSDNMDNR